MIRRLITLLTMTVAFYATVIAGNVLSLTSAKGHPNEEVTVDIALDNSDAVAAVQLDIPLDASLKYVDGSALLEPGRSGGHSLSVSQVYPIRHERCRTGLPSERRTSDCYGACHQGVDNQHKLWAPNHQRRIYPECGATK